MTATHTADILTDYLIVCEKSKMLTAKFRKHMREISTGCTGGNDGLAALKHCFT